MKGLCGMSDNTYNSCDCCSSDCNCASCDCGDLDSCLSCECCDTECTTDADHCLCD